MRLTIQRKLLAGFGSVLLIVSFVSIFSFIEINDVSRIEHRLTELRLPTVMASMQLTDGIHLSLAGLRGYMILGKDPDKAKIFKAERQRGWVQIDEALAKMDGFSEKWTDARNIDLLQETKDLVAEFRAAQQEVEDISHTTKNIPSYNLLITQAAPRAAKIIAALTEIIDEEAKQPATSERKALLKLLADSRGSFAIGLANIRAYLLSGDTEFADNFKAKWKVNEARFKAIKSEGHLFTSKQTKSWKTYTKLRTEFAPLPKKMFELRTTKDWNQANYWLSTKAAPKAAAVSERLKLMRASQEKLAAIDQTVLDDEIVAVDTAIVIGGFISVVLGLGIAILINRIIIVRLSRIVERADEISQGSLSSADLEVKGNDELTELTVSMNRMSGNLREVVTLITESAKKIGHSSKDLSSITNLTSQNIMEQQAQTEQAAAAMTEMSASVREVTSNISGTAQAADEANMETKTGNQVVGEAIQAVQSLGTQIENAASVILRLEQDTADIGSVLEVIKNVAEQTNLLALNAAIEAARAGEQGRGFAVVADEVRTLAARTQESTAEISQVIEKLLSGSQMAVEVMNESRDAAKSVVELATNAGTSLSAISESVDNINSMSLDIASAAEQQSAASEEINQNIHSISAMAAETSEGAKQTKNASNSLSKLSAELQDLTRRFSFQ